MANKHLSIKPTELAPECWFYEQPGGLEVVVEFRTPDGTYFGTRHYKITWTRLRAALKRKDAEDKPRKERGR